MYSGKNIDTSHTAETLAALVQSDRVHTCLYTSEEIFDLEIDNIFNRTGYGSPTRAKSLTPAAINPRWWVPSR